MSFNSREISTQDGQPVALYHLKWGKTDWRYTSADRAIQRTEIVNGLPATVIYEPRAVSDSGVVQGSSSQNDFTMDGPADLPIVALFRSTPTSETIVLTVRRMHFGDDDAPIYWNGLVLNVRRTDLASCQIIGKPLAATMKRTGLRLCWTRECPHYLYDSGCKVDPEPYKIEATIIGLTGTTVRVSVEAPTDYLRGGYLSWQASADGTIERRMIARQDGDVLTLLGLTDGLEIGQALNLYPGCDRSPEVCDGRYDNLDNYGGFDKMPGASPFNTAIW